MAEVTTTEDAARAFDHWDPRQADDSYPLLTAPARGVPGCPVATGDQVLLSLPAANRDRRRFERADEFVFDRFPNPHLAFGAGIHRCIGAHIARMELRVGLQELLAGTPTFHLADADADADADGVVWKGGPIRGPKAIRLSFSGTARSGSARR